MTDSSTKDTNNASKNHPKRISSAETPLSGGHEPLGVILEEALAAEPSQTPSRLRRYFTSQFSSTPSLAVFCAIGAAILIGMASIFVRMSEVPPIATAFFRFFLAGPFLITWMMYDNVKTDEARLPTRPIEYALMVLGGLFFALDLTFWHWSITLTTIVNATMLNNTTPIFVAFFGWLVFGEKPSSFLILGLFIAIVGALVLASTSFYETANGIGDSFGDFLGVCSAIMYAGYILIQKYLRRSFTTPTVMAWTSLSTMYFCAIFAIFEEGHFFPTSTIGWLNLFTLALIVHVFGQGLMAYVMRHISAGFTAMTMMLGPVAASILAWPLFGEAIGLYQIIGSAIILSGILVARKSEH